MKMTKKVLSILLSMIMVLVMCAVFAGALTTDGNNYVVSSGEDLISAFSDINSKDSGEFTITIDSDITVDTVLKLDKSRAVVTIYGENHTIYSVNSNIYITGGAVLNLGDASYNKTLSIIDKPPQTGNAATPLIAVTGSSVLNMYNGVILSGRNGLDTAGGVQLEQAIFNMFGGEINGCKSESSTAGGVLVSSNSVFNMRGGSIKNCSSVGYYGKGGGVYVTGSAFEMSGGTIENCSSVYYGGGVCVYSNSSFTMNGGSIKNCSSQGYGGGGVCVYMSSADITGFKMTGGKITDCTAEPNNSNGHSYGLGGGVLIVRGTAEITDGSAVYNNQAVMAGDDIFTFGTNKSTKLKLGEVPEGLILSETNYAIDGWYADGALGGEDTDRWSEDYMQKFTPDPDAVIDTQIALKAAHGPIDYNYYNYTVYIDGEVYATGTASSVDVDVSGIEIKDNYKIGNVEYTDVTEPTSQSPGSFNVFVTSAPITYIATFIADGKTVDEVEFTVDDDSIDEPEVPTKEGYEGKWSEYTLAASDITIQAEYTTIEYTVTFFVDGEQYSQFTVPFGEAVSSPRTPQKDNYDFIGWDAEIPDTMPAQNLEFNAVFKAIEYTATFVDENGETVKEVKFTVEDDSIDEPAVPEKEGYEGKWSAFTLAAADITIPAEYTAIEYTATFVDENGETVEEVKFTVETEKLDEPAVPEKTNYTGEWEEYELGASDITIRPVYTLAGETVVKTDSESEITTDYKESKRFAFEPEFVPEGATAHVFYNGEDRGEGISIEVKEPTDDYTVECKVLDADGNEIATSGEIKVKVKNSFFDRLKWFFNNLLTSILKPFIDALFAAC